MRIISSILSVLILFLAIIPCDDVQAEGHLDELLSLHTEEAHHDHDSHSGTDECSPFCVCQCCQTAVVFPFQDVDTLVITHRIPQKLGEYQPIYFSSIIFAIWRPPQFV